MLGLKSIGVIALVTALGMAGAPAQVPGKYPDWAGAWERIGSGSYDPSKPVGRAQQPPLTAEYQAIWEKNLAEEATGGQEYNTQAHCLPGGMPRMMIAYQPMEIIITPDVTYLHIAFFHELRRIYTDGRDWPTSIVPTFSGYSIGRWVDADAAGRYRTLEIETRAMRGRASSIRAASRSMRTTRPSSRNASSWTRPVRISSTTRSRPSTMP